MFIYILYTVIYIIYERKNNWDPLRFSVLLWPQYTCMYILIIIRNSPEVVLSYGRRQCKPAHSVAGVCWNLGAKAWQDWHGTGPVLMQYQCEMISKKTIFAQNSMQQFEPDWSPGAPKVCWHQLFEIDSWFIIYPCLSRMPGTVFWILIGKPTLNPYSVPGPLGWWYKWNNFWPRCRPSMITWRPSCQRLQFTRNPCPSPLIAIEGVSYKFVIWYFYNIQIDTYCFLSYMWGKLLIM